jgi:tRNA(Ile)-lysidine synthase
MTHRSVPLHPFETRLARRWPPQRWRDVTVVVAVSGGADSVALLRAAAALKSGGEGRLVAAHFNHALRGAESDRDAAFVEELCERLSVACEMGIAPPHRTEVPSEARSEAAARQRRYRFLARTAERLGARLVATGHTADDQAETILHRIVRGTGVRGLAGMARRRRLGPATLVRPLLSFHRAELVAYLDAVGQSYRHDASNDDLRFTRNRIRHTLLPLLAREFNPAVVEALARLGALAAGVEATLEALVEMEASRRVVETGPASMRIDAAGLDAYPRHFLRELLRAAWTGRQWPLQAMGYPQWDDLAALLAAATEPAAAGRPPPRRCFPGHVLSEVRAGSLELTRRGP